ncbi:hypothetical protein FV233_21895 [Methylobacterium sp. WL7]|nr:hypothetical protein FV233_21895 [Methylobacterium sp. WL7]
MFTQRVERGSTRPLSRAGEGWGEGPGLSGEVASLTLSLSRTGEGTCASPARVSPSPMGESSSPPGRGDPRRVPAPGLRKSV